MTTTVPLPPPWLDGEDFPRLNNWFYKIEPHSYFDVRLALLMAHAGRPKLLGEVVREGVEYRGLKVGGKEVHTGDDEDDDFGTTEEELHLHFVITESVALLHHISETLLRFYLVHARAPQCPWLEIAKELSHVDFKRKVRQRFDGAPIDEERREEVAWTLFASKVSVDDVPLDKWNASVENAERWMSHFADWFLGESNLFNVTKHGLAVHPGESSLQLMTPADEDGKPLIHAEGPSVMFLEKMGDPRRWHHTARWVDPARLMAEAGVGLRLLKSVWQVGRMRYTDFGREPQRLILFYRPDYNEYMDSLLEPGEAGKVILNRMSMNLSYRYAYQPELVCVKCSRTPGGRAGTHHVARST
jgi:hypothetical protein